MTTDIKLESFETHLEAKYAESAHLIALAREQSLRDLARPFLKVGYYPEELTAIEHGSFWFHDLPVFVSVQVDKRRSPLRLWCRRVLYRLHLRRRQSCFGVKQSWK